MIMMHFTSSRKLCSYLGPGGKAVTVMHIIYGSTGDKREAKLVYEVGEETVHIKGADWQIMFDVVLSIAAVNADDFYSL